MERFNEMKFYEQIDYLTPGFEYTEYTGKHIPLKFLKICDLSKKEDMLPLTLEAIRGNPFGMAAVGTYQTRGGDKKNVLSHATIGSFEELDSANFALIGGVITLRAARGLGFASETITKLMDLASTPGAVEAHGHTGFMAKCNPAAEKLFAGLGFTATSKLREGGKQIMVKMIEEI